jgi:hypothetical protein
LLLTAGTIFAQSNPPSPDTPCANIARLGAKLSQSKHPANILLHMGKLSEKISDETPPELSAFQTNPDYKNICHYKIIHSENFGDFPSYDGWHYQQILKKYPHSELADDAAYALVYIIMEDTYNFSDVRIEKKKLNAFLRQYPLSNKAKEAKTRIRAIDKALASGEPPILD